MTRLSPRHPRYRSLVTRRDLATAYRRGVVALEGLVAHGRGEAFDYFLGERTTRTARAAERTAAAWLAEARRPVVTVNGNVAALAAKEIADLARARPGLAVEVNLFHRTLSRARLIARLLRAAGVREVLGVIPSATIRGLASDRARVDRRGLWEADVCLIPLEDGGRAEALKRMGKRIISIDLNPFSRTSRAADLPIVDDLLRSLRNIAHDLRHPVPRTARSRFSPFDPERALRHARRAMALRLSREVPRSLRRAPGRASRRPARGSGRRRRRTR